MCTAFAGFRWPSGGEGPKATVSLQSWGFRNGTPADTGAHLHKWSRKARWTLETHDKLQNSFQNSMPTCPYGTNIPLLSHILGDVTMKEYVLIQIILPQCISDRALEENFNLSCNMNKYKTQFSYQRPLLEYSAHARMHIHEHCWIHCSILHLFHLLWNSQLCTGFSNTIHP